MSSEHDLAGNDATVRRETLVVDDQQSLETIVVQGALSGPRVALLAAVHGDELEGVLALRRLSRRLPDIVCRGTVLLVPMANPAACAAQSRDNPLDGKNLARVFPGDASGSAAQRLARALTDSIIRGSDLLIDLHSGGRLYDMPFFVGYRDYASVVSDRAAQAARAFGASLIWLHQSDAPGRTLSAAQQYDVPAIYVETHGGGSIRAQDVDAYERGVLSVLARLGCVPACFLESAAPPELLRSHGGNIDEALTAPCAGMYVVDAAAGQRVEQGTLLGEIYGRDGALLDRIASPCTGMVMLTRRPAHVSAGDVVAMIAQYDTSRRE